MITIRSPDGEHARSSTDGKSLSLLTLDPTPAPSSPSPAFAFRRPVGTIGGVTLEARARILIVEDDETTREVLTMALSRDGYEIITAAEGAEAIEMAEREQPDLIVMDLSLPGVDGWQATGRLRGLDSTRHIPVIAVTAHALGSDRARALEVGCDDFETKPVEIPVLREKIRALLRPRFRIRGGNDEHKEAR
ncbi:MAG: response regulator [Planctomycetota bacterium]|jgi:CheY-like chemotaxis protein